MYYYKARIYSSRLGRFLQTDPIGYKDQMNLHTYAANDPINFGDPTGLDHEPGCRTDGPDGSDCVVTAPPPPLSATLPPGVIAAGSNGDHRQTMQSEGCGSGPRLVIGRSFGGTLFGGVGDTALGGSLNAGIGLSIPFNFFRTGSLSGSQIFASGTLTALVKGVGAFAAITTGRSIGYATGPLSSHIPSLQEPGSYAVQAGGAWGRGAEVQLSGPTDNLAGSGNISTAVGYGAYFGSGPQVNITYASQEFGCE